ncbi:MAG: 1-deoxy-D-xylulose-5-phosphate synthase [Planctomycetes bacterium]|nr:1-deoxy-D-xylulose-5-phosphate synthase [Planctomycetota bacterium]
MLPASRIMYVECKSGGLEGPACIARVAFSKSGRSVYFRGRLLQRLGGQGFKANFVDPDTRVEYWVSGPKRNGRDRLYASGTVAIDEDVLEEYWLTIRGNPECSGQGTYRC